MRLLTLVCIVILCSHICFAGGQISNEKKKDATEQSGQATPHIDAKSTAASASDKTPCKSSPKILSGRGGLLEGLSTRGGRTTSIITIAEIDMTSDCLPPQFETTVPNQQAVVLQLKALPTDHCGAAPSFKADPKADYGAILAAFFKASVGNLVAPGPPPPIGEKEFIALPPATNGAMTVVVTCPRPESQDPTPMPRTVIIHYKNPPQFSASAGSLISFFPKRVYGASTSQTGVNSAGVATTQNSVAITSSSKVQFVPIAFLNTYISGSSRLHFDLQAGAGINPNGSKTQVEYFLGPALTTHGIYISPGVHIARGAYLANGFTLGEVIPSGVTPPVSYRTTYRFAIAISYSPPVKSTP